MLTRAARRRYALRYVQATAEHIQLPWLCPALPHYQNNIRQSRPITSHPPSRRKPRITNTSPSRHLASAAGPIEAFASHDDYVPFPYSTNSHDGLPSKYPAESQPWSSPFQKTIDSLDFSDILTIDRSISLPPPRLTSGRRLGIEIHGDAIDIEVTLDACLQVGQWDRALAMLRQLQYTYARGGHNTRELLGSYNKFLEAMVMDLVLNRNQGNIDRINRWVEVEMKQGGVTPDARTYALKIKTALATMSGSKRDRTVRRYWELAKEHDFEAEVAGLREILTDGDLGKLSEICPQLKFDFEIEKEITFNTDQSTNPLHAADALKNIYILETQQKGLGLEALRKSLGVFSETPLNEDNLSNEEGEAAGKDRQMRLEADSLNAAIERWRFEHEKQVKMGINSAFQKGNIGALLWQWHTSMTKKLCKEMEAVEKSEAMQVKTPRDKFRCEYGPFLRLLPPEHISAMTTITLMQIMSKKGVAHQVKLGRMVCELGSTLEMEVEAENLRKQAARRKEKSQQGKSWSAAEAIPEHASQPFRHRKPGASRLYSKRLLWSHAIHARIGAILCELLFDSAKIAVRKQDPETGITNSVPETVFMRGKMYQHGKQIGVVTMHPSMVEMMGSQPAADLIAKQLPMVAKPRPWKDFYDGGYLSSTNPFVRIKHNELSQRDYGEAAAARGDLDLLFAGVDVLGRTAWTINGNVFNVMVEAWNSGEAVANLPPVEKVFPEVPRPASDATAKQRWDYFNAIRAQENEKSGLHSNRCFQNFQMEIAKAYRKEVFYLPHNVDFRGRAYPIPPYLNQMGADNCRGLLLFARGRALGSDGLRWLKIHLANVFGYDKASLADREKFPMDRIEDVLDSVRNPLGGKRWWLTAEDPWQCLATCFELSKALECSDPTKYISHLPVHQDGSCNGLQHYAALGGDIAGAKQVNLEPGDKPADVYTGVADLVKAEIKAEAAQGHPMGMFLDGKVTRKVVKQTVMTNVYGVTFLGAVHQVRRQIDAIMPELVVERRSGVTAAYITRKIFKALGTMFNGAHQIQYWLGDCANRITTSLTPTQQDQIARHDPKENSLRPTGRGRAAKKPKKTHLLDPSLFRSSVIWTTPLKLPVVQPYRVNKGIHIKTNLQQIRLVEPTVADATHKRKQLQAFPPNFVHSLDATHMILSALKADEMGLDFTAVHDSFWTHAADVKTMNVLLRDAFIRMHSEDIIGRLFTEFKHRYRGHIYLATIKKDNDFGMELAELRKDKTKYCYGRSAEGIKYQELLWEIERQRLLNSDKLEEVKMGEEMITPSSIFLKYNGEQYLQSKDSLGQTAIGEVPADMSDAVLESAVESKDLKDSVDMATTLEPLLEDNDVLRKGNAPAVESEDFNDDIDIAKSLDPLLQNNAVLGGGDEVNAEAVDEDDFEVVDENMKKAAEMERKEKRKKNDKKKYKIAQTKITQIWLPLTFRDVPKKGEFDVTRLKDSQYFFS